MHGIMSLIVALCFTGGMIWNVSNQTARFAIKEPTMPFGEIDKLRALIEGVSIPIWWLGVAAVIYAYLWLLTTFPAWLLPDQPPPDREDKRPERIDDQK
jgi:hypothetical protein